MNRGRVLIVDDSALLRAVLADTFRPAGFEVIEAAEGQEALRAIEAGRPDLIIADILMPVMDGWALCEEVRRQEGLADVPFIFLTTERDVPKRIRGLERGADDYVCKPFSKEELLARAEAVLRRASRARPDPQCGTTADRMSDTQPVQPITQVPPLSGHTDHIAMADLLQLLSMNGRTGTLNLFGESVGRIYFQAGQIVNAETQGVKGEKALFRIMAWPAVRFEFEMGEPARKVDKAITSSTSNVMMEGFAHLDELHDLMAQLPHRGVRLRVPRSKVTKIENLPLDTTQRIILFNAAGKGALVADILDIVPLKDLDVYHAISHLMTDGLLEVADEEVGHPAPDHQI